MIRVIFKDLKRSEFLENVVVMKMQDVIEKFPDLHDHQVLITLSMENSPRHPGPDSFTAKLYITGRRFGRIVLEKSSHTMYASIADLSDVLLERLNRALDRARVRGRAQERRWRMSS
ncbi:MAG: HPF/RaiA family ribosome-associated protein [Bdellovibrionales bacterium]